MVNSGYSVSINYDHRLYRQDIMGSVAHTKMLARQGIISLEDSKLIIKGLSDIEVEIRNGIFPWKMDLEDIHMNIESRLFDLIGEPAGRLHTARSRNDQVAVDMRLYLKEVLQGVLGGIITLQRVIFDFASNNKDVILPGYTHLQRAQPVLLAHHFLAYFHMLQRDKERFQECVHRVDVLPLGSGALAGVTYPIDREFIALELGFASISENSMDAVSDRDYLLEFMSDSALCMAHLSRLAEDLILWSSQEFDFIRLSNEYTTGSSMMPQKRNPDFAELARGKTGRVYGNLFALLTVMKGLPLTYNRDLQEDKESFFDTVDTMFGTLEVFRGMIGTVEVKDKQMRNAAEGGYALATDIADYLVSKGVSFRDAYRIMVRLTSYAVTEGKSFQELTLEEYKHFSDQFDALVFDINIDVSIKSRDVPGGTSPTQVNKALDRARVLLEM